MIEPFEMERMQSTWENLVERDLSESGVRAVTLKELVDLGLDLDQAMDMPLGYSQSNGTPELKNLLTKIYPGASEENIEVTNGTAEANYVVALALMKPGDEFALELPNYMQLFGVPRSLGATVNTFHLRPERNWEPDWEEFEKVVNGKTRAIYITNPNNPSGSVLSDAAMRRIVDRCEQTGAYLIADEVYIGAEIHRERTKSFWGLSDRVIVTSGLSKAYGIPGVRIGWIVGPKKLIYDCWTQHDYITIGPNKLSDLIARTAVQLDVREKLYDRTRAILKNNVPIMQQFVNSLNGKLTFKPPQAGALCLMKYAWDIASFELCERIRKHRSTLIVPGSHFGLEGYIRLWLGARPEVLQDGLQRVAAELRAS
jgi:aspartate/methionine/tyrosine aminotransferase